MKKTFCYLLFLLPLFGYSQGQRINTFFLKNNGKYVSLPDSADYMRIISAPDSGSNLYYVTEYFLNGKKKLIGRSLTIDPPKFDGDFMSYYRNGHHHTTATFKNGLAVGTMYSFYPTGKPYLVKDYPDNGDRYNDIHNEYLVKECYDSVGTALVINGNGRCKIYGDDFKEVFEEGDVKNGKRDGLWKGSSKPTVSSFTETYVDGNLISGSATFLDGQTALYKDSRGVVPQFKGGIEAFGNYLSKNIRYPREERYRNIQGQVIVSFIVEKDGKVTDVKIAKSVSPNIDAEAIKVISKSPLWIPGMQFGRSVRVAYAVPIAFTLSN